MAENHNPVRNVFISFHIDDEAQVNLLRAQAKSPRMPLEFRDHSVKEPFDSRWKEQCREKIARTSLTICMIGEHTYERPAVNWELETSYEMGHKVVGVRIYRDSQHRVPEILIRNQAPILDWDLNEIVSEIETLSVQCNAQTKTTGQPCRNRVLPPPPCWHHRIKPEQLVASSPQSEGLGRIFIEILKQVFS